MTNDTYYKGSTFSTISNSYAPQIREIIKNFLNSTSALRLLDLGCGTGANLLDFSNLVSNSTLVGIDISDKNIENAKLNLKEANEFNNNHIIFERGDYLDHQTAPFDIIYAESVLHLIVHPTDVLYAKISKDLNSSGLLIAIMPYDCLYNRILILFRRFLKLLEGPFFNELIFRIAKRVYPALDPKALRDRIPYLYIIPSRLDSEKLREKIETDYHLRVIKIEKLPSLSIAKPKHNLIVFKKY